MRNLIQLKSCSRCGGDMMLEEYLGDSELVCLQCGHRTAMVQTRDIPAAARAGGERSGERKAA